MGEKEKEDLQGFLKKPRRTPRYDPCDFLYYLSTFQIGLLMLEIILWWFVYGLSLAWHPLLLWWFCLDKCMTLGSSLLRDVLGPTSCAYYKPILMVLWLFMLRFIKEMMKSSLIEWFFLLVYFFIHVVFRFLVGTPIHEYP